MHYIGKIDTNKIGNYGKKIVTKDIVLTDERKEHIFQTHTNDFALIMHHIDKVVLNPKEVIEDLKNTDTIYLIDKVEKNHLNVVVRLNTTNSKEHPQNSIMTAWLIRNRNLEKLSKKIKYFTKKNKCGIIYYNKVKIFEVEKVLLHT